MINFDTIEGKGKYTHTTKIFKMKEEILLTFTY